MYSGTSHSGTYCALSYIFNISRIVFIQLCRAPYMMDYKVLLTLLNAVTVFSSLILQNSPSDFEEFAKRTNLAESVQAAFNGRTSQKPLTALQNATEVPQKVISFPDVPQSAANISSTELKQNVTNPLMMTQIAIIQKVPLPSGENLFTGLAQNVGQLNILGVITEAFKLAQISVGLFSQALANQLSSNGIPMFVINNTTKLIGE